MRFEALRLSNWKNFQDVDVKLRDRMFLVGPNASGKSNFLDAFRFLRDLASTGGGFAEAIGRRGGVKTIRSLAARRYSDIAIEAEVSEGDCVRWRFELAFNQNRQRLPLVKSERIVRNGRTIVERPNEADEKDPARKTQTYLEQVIVNEPFRELVRFFSSIRYLHVVPQLIREPDRSIGLTNDPYGGDFLQQVAKTQTRTQKARLRRIQQALSVAVPQLERIELDRDDRGVPHLRGKYRHWRPQGAWQSEEQFSDGTLRLVGLLWSTMETGGPLLLEEPELSLHPEIVRVVPQLLARASRKTGRQILLSTHSSDLLRDDGIGVDEILLFLPQDEGTEVVQAATQADVLPLLQGGLSLADIVIPKTKPAAVGQLSMFSG